MGRIYIKNGVLHRHIEPWDMPGASLALKHECCDFEGGVPTKTIQWDGPGHFLASHAYARVGFGALWLGSEQATNPRIVHFKLEVTADSLVYEAGFRRGFLGKRAAAFREIAGKEVAFLDGYQDGRQQRRDIGT